MDISKLSLSVITLAVLLVNTGEAHEKQRCLSILTPDFESCDNLRHVDSTKDCSQVESCQKRFQFSTINVEPFVHILEKVIVSAIEMCCGSLQKCRTYSLYTNSSISMHNISFASLNDSNFVFPILSYQSTSIIYGFHFIPIFQLSSGYLITKPTTSTEVLNRLIKSCANLWPLLIIIILLSVIAGFIVWFPETWFNKDEFPRMFFHGLFESFWWAFVSMTTVGYGDKIPKFFISRLWSVIWILVGITICSIFTASLTNEITSASNDPDPIMHGKTIGVFKYRPFDAYLVANQGGRIKETRGISENDDFREITNMLSTGSVNGIFMDKLTYMHAATIAEEFEDAKHDRSPEVIRAVDFFLNEAHRTEVSNGGDKMAYGILVRDEEDYDFFEEFLRNNKILYETCALLKLNKHEVPNEELHNIFSAEDDDAPFFDFLYWCLGIIAGIVVIGLVFEIVRRSKKFNKVNNIPS